MSPFPRKATQAPRPCSPSSWPLGYASSSCPAILQTVLPRRNSDAVERALCFPCLHGKRLLRVAAFCAYGPCIPLPSTGHKDRFCRIMPPMPCSGNGKCPAPFPARHMVGLPLAGIHLPLIISLPPLRSSMPLRPSFFSTGSAAPESAYSLSSAIYKGQAPLRMRSKRLLRSCLLPAVAAYVLICALLRHPACFPQILFAVMGSLISAAREHGPRELRMAAAAASRIDALPGTLFPILRLSDGIAVNGSSPRSTPPVLRPLEERKNTGLGHRIFAASIKFLPPRQSPACSADTSRHVMLWSAAPCFADTAAGILRS